MEQIIKVQDFGELRYALEVLNAKTIVIDGMIDCGKNPLNLKAGQTLRGASHHAHLMFAFQTARSAIVAAGNVALEQLKIHVVAVNAPQDNVVKGAIVANGTVKLHDVDVYAEIEQEEVNYPKHLYALLLVRHLVILSGDIVFHGTGNCITGISGDNSAQACVKFNGEDFNLFMRDSVKPAVKGCVLTIEKKKFTYFYDQKKDGGEDEFVSATVRLCKSCSFEHNAYGRLDQFDAGEYYEIAAKVLIPEKPKKSFFDRLKFWRK